LHLSLGFVTIQNQGVLKMRTLSETKAKEELKATGPEWYWMWEHPCIKDADFRESVATVLKQ
jgi:hypothetical protein